MFSLMILDTLPYGLPCVSSISSILTDDPTFSISLSKMWRVLTPKASIVCISRKGLSMFLALWSILYYAAPLNVHAWCRALDWPSLLVHATNIYFPSFSEVASRSYLSTELNFPTVIYGWFLCISSRIFLIVRYISDLPIGTDGYLCFVLERVTNLGSVLSIHFTFITKICVRFYNLLCFVLFSIVITPLLLPSTVMSQTFTQYLIFIFIMCGV